MTGQSKKTYGTRNLNWPLFRKDYQYGFRVWCRKYSEGEDEGRPKTESQGRQDGSTPEFSFVPGQPTYEGFSSHPFVKDPERSPSSPLSRAQETQATSEERERAEHLSRQQEEELLDHVAHSQVPKRSWWNRLLCFCRGPKPEGDTNAPESSHLNEPNEAPFGDDDGSGTLD